MDWIPTLGGLQSTHPIIQCRLNNPQTELPPFSSPRPILTAPRAGLGCVSSAQFLACADRC